MIGDGRELLLTTGDRYDLIFSEPSNPYRAGVASLFSADFYRRREATACGRGASSCSGSRATSWTPRWCARPTPRWPRSSRRSRAGRSTGPTCC